MPAGKQAFIVVLCALTVSGAEGTHLSFPPDLLTGEDRQSLKEVVEDSTLHRQFGGLRVPGRRAVFQHLMSHPDFAARLAREAGILKYTVTRQGPAQYWADDNKGLAGRLELLRIVGGDLVLYAEGTYRKGLLRIPGRFALVIRSSEGRDQESFYVDNTLSAYVRVDAALLDPLARLFRPLVDRIMQKRVNWFFGKVSRLMALLTADPEAVLNRLPPEDWREEVMRLRLLLRDREAIDRSVMERDASHCPAAVDRPSDIRLPLVAGALS